MVPKVMIWVTLSSPYFCFDVLDHLAAPMVVEVDVDVRHRHALGIQEALEDEPVPQRVDVGDPERVGDERPGRRAAARPDADAPARARTRMKSRTMRK